MSRINHDKEYTILDHPLPISIQEFLWKQTRLFVRPKFGKHHEASCIFCQNTHIHNDMKEACKILEKVLVQNSPLNPYYKTVNSINRWILIQSAFPHVVHCVAALLQYRRDVLDLQRVNQTESKLLYILHWLILDSADECIGDDMEKGIHQSSPFYYVFPITSITLFVYLIAPLVNRIKEPDLQSYRLENGLKIWRPLWEFQHPEAACFTTYCKTNPKHAYVKSLNLLDMEKAPFKRQFSRDDCCITLESPQSPNVSCDERGSSSMPSSNGQTTTSGTTGSSGQSATTKTVVTEYSHKTGEHMVIFRLPSLPESEDPLQNSPATVFSGKVPILQLAMGRAVGTGARASLPCEQLQVPADIKNITARHSITNTGLTIDRNIFDGGKLCRKPSLTPAIPPTNLHAATFLDVAVLRCLFISQWSEEGIYWALNFLYRRLLVMNEILSNEEQPRKRSNSLPARKVGIFSNTNNNETRRREYRDSTDTLVHKGSPVLKITAVSDTLEHHKQTEKAKKKMKMADLRNFVEAKLLSRSEKNLEKLDHISSKEYFETEYHRSLDMEDTKKRMTHPTTSLAKFGDLHELGDDSSATFGVGLVKGTSMPSLSCLLDETENQKWIGEKMTDYSDSQGLCNPIITVTQHSPNPSPEYLRRKNSVNAHFESKNIKIEKHIKQPSISRSQSDFNISYMGDMVNEAPGSVHFITEDGDLDITAVLKALYNITMKDKAFCTVTVCEIILRVIELLIEMGILKKLIPVEPLCRDEGSLLYSLELAALQKDNIRLTPEVLCLNCIFRIIKLLGCPNHCGEIPKSAAGVSHEFLRSRCNNILRILRKHNVIEFNKYIRRYVDEYSLPKVMEFFHSFLGYCMDPSSLLSPNQKRNMRSPDNFATGAYASNFGAGMNGPGNCHGIESQILSCIFKKLVTKCVKLSKESKIHDNMSLYHDVRWLINYVKEVHGGIFREVLLSGLIETVIKPHSKPSNVQTTKVFRHMSQEEREKRRQSEACFIVDDRETKRTLFKKRSISSTGASLHDTEEVEDKVLLQSPHSIGKSKFHAVLTPRQSERNLKSHITNVGGVRSHSKFPITGIVNWLRKEYGRSESTESRHSDSPIESALARQISAMSCPQSSKSQQQKTVSKVSKHLMKARKRVGDQLNKFGLKKGKKNSRSTEESVGSYFSRRNSVETGKGSRDSEYAILKERRLVSTETLLIGMQRFSYLMETCYPGTVPDPQLVASVLDLPYTPVIARATFLLECAYFVHCCNRGQWPMWMKFNLPGFRPSGNLPYIRTSTAPNGARRTQLLQKTAGKLFYLWGVGISARLEEMMESDKENMISACMMVCNENKHAELRAEDEEEDFLDEATSSLFTPECPFALRMMACVLLMEITAYLRDTYENLPKSMRKSARGDRSTVWEKNYYKDRRFSAALSSMGHSQTSAQSLQSIPGDRETTGERKISFVLNEPDGESEESTNTTNTGHTDDMQYQGHVDDKRSIRKHANSQNRPYLLRRSTAGAVQSGSDKRQSYKLKKTRDGADNDFKRVDSIQSKRQKGSLSDRSDTSEPGIGSGDESPNVGESPDEQPPESPTDSNDTDDASGNFPWIKIVIQMMNSLNYVCSHHKFCHPFCYRRQMRACSRLTRAIRKIYGDNFEVVEPETLLSKPVSKDFKSHRSTDRNVSFPSPIKRKESIEKKLGFIDDGKEATLISESTSDKLLDWVGVRKSDAKKQSTEAAPIAKYLKTQVRDGFHAPLAIIVKSIVVLNEESVRDALPVAWDLLLESNQELSATAASAFIVSSFRAPSKAVEIIQFYLNNDDPKTKIDAILKFQVLWKHRYQPWPRMEDRAQSTFKLPPPAIEFTLTSPRIGIESLPVVDPPWMPVVDNIQVDKLGEDKHRSFTSHSRKKDKISLEFTFNTEKQKSQDEDRKAFLISAIPITIQAANESGVHHTTDSSPAVDHTEPIEEINDAQQKPSNIHLQTQAPTQVQTQSQAQPLMSLFPLFPSCLCSAVVDIIGLLDESSICPKGVAVYEVAYNVIWNCLVEDSSLFLRYILERLTRDNQERMFMLLRYLIRFIPKLPQQAAFALYNYIIGYVMFYVRSYHEDGQRMIGAALSILWMVVHSVHGIMFKDLKQILRKEQCDASILLTANVPSTKKIIVHGPQEADGGGIPSQFPVQEDTQFFQIWKESVDFFSIDESKLKEYFLVDHKTHQIRNLNSYVRDYYFFKRSQYPQLELVHMNPSDALDALQKQDLHHKFIEIGKVLLTWAILKNVDMVVQRVVFLHEELMKLPSFPRKALDADLDLYKNGDMGKILLGLDMLHKFMWVRLIARMFEAMAGNFAYSGDIHLFINVLNGALILHGEDACILRYVMATYINAAHNFKNIFSTNGYFLIIPTLMQHYSSHQANKLVTKTIEYTVKQFYLMNRKPFLLQMFGSVSSMLDMDESTEYGSVYKVEPQHLFRLLLSLERTSFDPLYIDELVKEEKPLKAIDFCYHDESETVTILDCIELCVMVVSYAADTVRAYQMLLILEAIIPCYLKEIQLNTYEKNGKTEREIIAQLAVSVKTLVNGSEALTKNYNGPQKFSPEHKSSSQRNFNKGGPYSPAYDFDEEAQPRYVSDKGRIKSSCERDTEDYEMKSEFRRSRDVLLSTVVDFVSKCSMRLIELNKKFPLDGNNVELLELRSYIRMGDIVHTLLKLAPYDPETMNCKGLQAYMSQLLPGTDWNSEILRPTFLTLLRRLDKIFVTIRMKSSVRRGTDWNAASGLIKGVYETLSRYPYIAHLPSMRALVSTCLSLITADMTGIGMGEVMSVAVMAVMNQIPPELFCTAVLRLVSLQILALGDTYSLELACGMGFSLQIPDKIENILVTFLLPLCFEVGTGRQDIGCIRKHDLCFVLTVILHTMCPQMARFFPTVIQNFKCLSDMRAVALDLGSKHVKSPVIPPSLYRVTFLGLKIMMICFESELDIEWVRIARAVSETGKVPEARSQLWRFIEFIVTNRNPLFILLLSFIHQKISLPPFNEYEKQMQQIVSDKLSSANLPLPKCRGDLLIDLYEELKEIKLELECYKRVEQSRKQKDKVRASVTDVPVQRISLSDLLSGHLSASAAQMHRGSITSTQGSGSTINISLSSTTKVNEVSSPLDEASSNFVEKPFKSRLHRSKAQSRKTFKFRKSKIEKLQIKSEPSSVSPSQVQSPTTITEQPMNVESPPPVNINQNPRMLATSQNTFETSWEEESLLSQTTSSTSGYRENCSLLMMQMESPLELKQHVYPDIEGFQSASSSTIVPPTGSPESFSSNENDNLCSSQHSVLMIRTTKDNITML